jgi:hypothetical protein
LALPLYVIFEESVGIVEEEPDKTVKEEYDGSDGVEGKSGRAVKEESSEGGMARYVGCSSSARK